MEKLQQLTKYDKLANEAGIIDKNVFLDNIKALANYDDKYKNIFNDLLKLSKEYVEIEPNIEYDKWFTELGRTYNVTGGLLFHPLYCIVCDYTNTKLQEYFDFEEMKRTVYNFYVKDYNKFIELIKQVITPSGRCKWTTVIPLKEKEQLTDIRLDAHGIPEVPFIPDELLREIK